VTHVPGRRRHSSWIGGGLLSSATGCRYVAILGVLHGPQAVAHAGRVVGTPLLDHVVIARRRASSMLEAGLLG
jgi:hypothetical protein